MRERLTVAFVGLTIALLLTVFAFWTYSLHALLRQHDSDRLSHDLDTLTVLVHQRQVLDRPVDADFLDGLTGEQLEITYAEPGAKPVVVSGPQYAPAADPDDDLQVAGKAGGADITITEGGDVVSRLVLDAVRPILITGLLLTGLAGLFGFVISRALTQPFRQLALAAAALGRGRFDLDLPRTGIPEARSIATALSASAAQLQERLHREQEFAEHASHVLRTPLTGLRLEMEELTLRSDLPQDARDAAARGLAGIAEVNRVAGELVELSRRGALVEGAEISLRDLATVCAQRWADELADHDRLLTAAVEGDIELTYTPGPVEHILDLLLVDVLRRGAGAVRMVFDSDRDGHLKIQVRSAGVSPGKPASAEPSVAEARAVVLALGGRMQGESPMDGIEVLLPRR